MKIRRLRKLEKFLRTLPEEKFNFSSFVQSYNKEDMCGTVCCAIGWMPKVDPKSWEWCGMGLRYNKSYLNLFSAAAHYFGIEALDAQNLFDYHGAAMDERSPYYMHRQSSSEVTSVDVADAINEFITNGAGDAP